MKRCLPTFSKFLNTMSRSRKMLLYMLLGMGLLCLLICVNNADADDVSIKVVENGILNDDLIMQFHADEIFTEKVLIFLTRGFTVQIEYVIELWQSRRWWFDRLSSQYNIKYQIEFEPLEKRYTCLISRQGELITSKVTDRLGHVIQWTTRPELPIIISPMTLLNPKASYYYNIVVSIATLTAENISDLRKWIEYGGKEKKSSTLTKTSFKLARDAISARHRKRISARSGQFRPSKLHRFNNG